MSDKLFSLTRNQLARQYEQSGKGFNVVTRIYESTLCFVGTVSDFVAAAAGPPATPARAVVTFDPQTLNFFSYKQGDPIPSTLGTPAATGRMDDTNLKEGSKTNSSEDMAVEGIAMCVRNVEAIYTAGNAPTYTAPSALSAFTGGGSAALDPMSINTPPAVQSPFNLEESVLQLFRHSYASATWDKRTEPIATCDLFAQGAAGSALRANGLPSPDCFFRLPEGYLWKGSNSGPGPDSNFQIQVQLARSVVIPTVCVAPQGQAAERAPTHVRVWAKMRVRGPAFSFQSKV